MTPEHPGFAAAVRVAKRALAERIAAKAAADRETSPDATAAAPVRTSAPDSHDPPENIAKPWKKPWDK
jgi:hypothetical protein